MTLDVSSQTLGETLSFRNYIYLLFLTLNLIIHGVNLRLEALGDDVATVSGGLRPHLPLDLLGRSQKVVVEGFDAGVDLADHLKPGCQQRFTVLRTR